MRIVPRIDLKKDVEALPDYIKSATVTLQEFDLFLCQHVSNIMKPASSTDYNTL